MSPRDYTIIFVTMALFMTFMGIPTGLTVILNQLGININPATLQFINISLGNSVFWNWIFTEGALAVLVSSGVGAIIVGFFARSYDSSLIILPIIISFAGLYISLFGITILYVVNTIQQAWATNLIVTVFGALGLGFIWSCVSYFAGRND